MEDIILVQKDLQDKMNQGKKESQKLESPEAKAIYEEMCDCFDKLVMLTKRYKAEGRLRLIKNGIRALSGYRFFHHSRNIRI